jgi:hypothetical protein
MVGEGTMEAFFLHCLSRRQGSGYFLRFSNKSKATVVIKDRGGLPVQVVRLQSPCVICAKCLVNSRYSVNIWFVQKAQNNSGNSHFRVARYDNWEDTWKSSALWLDFYSQGH